MLNIIIDNLSRLEVLGRYIPSVIQVGIVVFWILIFLRSKNAYKFSLAISLFLLFLSTVVLALSFTSEARMIGEYAFLFLGIGIIQILISKD